MVWGNNERLPRERIVGQAGDGSGRQGRGGTDSGSDPGFLDSVPAVGFVKGE